MRIGELDDTVGREFSARRGNMLTEAARLPAKLAEPVPGAIAPAASLLDAVHISPEARTAQFGRMSSDGPDMPLPGPGEIVSVLQDIEATPDSARATAGLQRLAVLVTLAARSFSPGVLQPNLPVDPRAGAIAELLLAHAEAPPGTAPPNRDVALLVRELLKSLPQSPLLLSPGMPEPVSLSRFEQAGVAILLAATREGHQLAYPFSSARPGDLPPALLSMLGPAGGTSRIKGVRRKLKDAGSRREDEAEDETSPEEGEPSTFPNPGAHRSQGSSEDGAATH